jgi:ribosomal protein S20
MRAVITSARRIRITARIVTLPSNTASRNKSRLANSSAALAEEFFLSLFL